MKEYIKKDVNFGYLREVSGRAIGYDGAFKLNRTGLDDYLRAIYSSVGDWVYDQKVPGLCHLNGKPCNMRPDWRSESLKLVIEFDGIDHYRVPDGEAADKYKNEVYESAGYKVVRIPYFIQLTNKVVKDLFGVDCPTKLFNESYPSLSGYDRNTPDFLCPKGIDRLFRELYDISPEQYKVNRDYAFKEDDSGFSTKAYFWEFEKSNKIHIE